MPSIASISSISALVQSAGRPAPASLPRRAEGGPPADAPPRAEPDESQVKRAIEAANVALRQVTSDLEFARDAATGKTVMRVIDSATQQVIRQFPSEEMLAIARALDRFEGLLIKQKA